MTAMKNHRLSLRNIAPMVLLAAALIGMIDSSYLLLKYIQALQHPGEPTPCTVNSLVTCTLTVQGPYGHYVPGIPNPLWGMLWYAGLTAYGLLRAAGTHVTRRSRGITGLILLSGILFSYRLYLASVLELGGVCPFCLISTTASTLISLAFFVDDASHSDPIIGARRGRRVFLAYQAFSMIVFVIGLPIFIISGLRWIPDPSTAVRHWSFPVMALLVIVMAAGHAWAFVVRKSFASR